MTRKIYCLLIFNWDYFVKHGKLRLLYKWNTAGCCTWSGFNAAILKINLVTISCTNEKINSHQQQIHHGNQRQEMAVGPFSHHRRKRFFSTYEGYKEVKSTVVSRQVTDELKHMSGARSLLTLAEKSRHWTNMTKIQFFKDGMRHIRLELKIKYTNDVCLGEKAARKYEPQT